MFDELALSFKTLDEYIYLSLCFIKLEKSLFCVLWCDKNISSMLCLCII